MGAGLGGLSAAIRLAARGWQVRVFEQQEIPGGKAGSELHDGYRFDTGPSLLTMPYVFDQLFEEAGRKRTDYLTFEPLNPICNYFWPDGARLSAPGGPSELAAAVEDALGEPAANTLRYLERAEEVHDIAATLFLWNSLHDRSTYLSGDFFRSLVKIGRIDAMRSLNSVHERFFDDPRVVQLFNRYATYNGSSPFRTPATMQIIPFVEYGHGGYAVRGGIHSIPRALQGVATELGVEFAFGTRVRRIAWEQNGRRRPVTGVYVSGAHEPVAGYPGDAGAAGGENAGEFVPADVVVSNVDVSVTYPELLGDTTARQLRRYHRLEPSSSGLVFYWGINRTFPELTVNNIFFSGDYPSEFRTIFDEGRCPEDPTIYVNITSKVSPEDARPGGENWFVLVNAPYTNGQDWESEVARTRETVARRISATLGCDIESVIEHESIMSPVDIERKTGSFRGALYGIGSNTKLASFARHPNRSRRYPGLYLCGGSAHPGGGMPLVLLSGKIASDLIARDRG